MTEMNTQEYKFFTLNTSDSWRQGFGETVRVQRQGGITLSAAGNLDLGSTDGYLSGVAFDKHNTLYAIDAKRCLLLKYDRQKQAFEPLPCFGGCGKHPWQFRFSPNNGQTFSGRLAFGSSILYVSDTFNHRIQAFHVPRWQLLFAIDAVTHNDQKIFGAPQFELHLPADIYVDRKRNFYVLDIGLKRILKFNRYGVFQRYVDSSNERSLENPIGIAVVSEDCDTKSHIYVLDAARSGVFKFDEMGKVVGNVVSFPEAGLSFTPLALAVDHEQQIYVSEANYDGSHKIHQFDETGHYLGFIEAEGNCDALAVDRQGQLYGSCGALGRVVQFGGGQTFSGQGTYYSREFDSNILDCKWHRIALDADLAEKTKVEVFYHASATPKNRQEIPPGGWQALLSTPYNFTPTKDALFNGSTGRYLRLKFILHGDHQHTPVIREARVYFQRLSYLRYLPATYMEDARGKDFLERFLSVFETMNYKMDEAITTLPAILEAATTVSEFFDWLESWLAIAKNENWPEAKRRQFFPHAFEAYKRRGTVAGLRQVVRIFTGQDATVVEHFRLQMPFVLGTKALLGVLTFVNESPANRLILEQNSTIGKFALNDTEPPPEAPFESAAYDFTILADTSALITDSEKRALQSLIEQERPAYTRCFLRTGDRATVSGCQRFLGVDTKLVLGFEPMRLDGTVQLGKSTFPGTRYREKGTLGTRSRIAIDAVLH